MISLKCPDCGFFFSVDFPDDIQKMNGSNCIPALAEQ